jgi:hypothetical protein
MAWTRRAILIYPVNAFDAPRKTAVAQAFVTHAALETLANELLMFDNAAPVSGDYGATETHRQISTALTPTLAAAVKTALVGVSGYWYLLDADTAALLDTNDAAKDDHGLDWGPGISLTAGELLRYEGQMYAVVQSHTSQSDWTCDVAKALFKRYRAPGEVSAFAQPAGSHDAYPLGARVTHNGKTYRSLVNANVWIPGAVGSEALWLDESAPVVGAWSGASVAYKVNDLVTYNGSTYKCLQAHTSQPGWFPSAVPALWQLQT